MENKPDSLAGLDSTGAKEYILGFLSTLKLTEKEIEKLKDEELKWIRRAELARDQGKTDLSIEAEREKEKITARIGELENEAGDLRIKIEKLREELRILPAMERSIDPDLLEQELLILAGRMPGEEEAERYRAFEKLENESAADSALEALKARMGKNFKT